MIIMLLCCCHSLPDVHYNNTATAPTPANIVLVAGGAVQAVVCGQGNVCILGDADGAVGWRGGRERGVGRYILALVRYITCSQGNRIEQSCCKS